MSAALHLGLDLIEADWFRQGVHARHRDPRITATAHYPHTTRINDERPVEPGERDDHAFTQIVDEGLGVGWLPQGFVVQILGCFEVSREVMVRVTPPAGVVDEHLPATDRVAESDEHAQLTRDSLYTAAIVDHGGPPALRHDTMFGVRPGSAVVGCRLSWMRLYGSPGAGATKIRSFAASRRSRASSSASVQW